jgi:hypothetical protein
MTPLENIEFTFGSEILLEPLIRLKYIKTDLFGGEK